MVNHTTIPPTTYYLLPSTTPGPDGEPQAKVPVPKGITTDDLVIIGWVLWIVVIITLVGNLCSFYAIFDRSNFKKIVDLDNPFLLSNILCATLSFVDLCQIISVGIPAAIAFTAPETKLEKTFYNKAVVDPLLDMIVWTQLFLIVAICLDRAGHILWPITYDLKPWMMFAAIVACPAIPFLTLTLPYIIATEANMQLSLDKGHTKDQVFRCLDAKHFENGEHLHSPHIFMGCSLQMYSDWPYTKSWQTWENISSPGILLLAVMSLTVTTSVIIFMLRKSAKFQKNNQERQRAVVRGIKTTCGISMFQAFLIVTSSLPLRWYQIYDRLNAVDCDYISGGCDSKFSTYYKIVTRILVFLAPIFNPWLYAFRMSNVRTFLTSKKKKFMKTGFGLCLRGGRSDSRKFSTASNSIKLGGYSTVVSGPGVEEEYL